MIHQRPPYLYFPGCSLMATNRAYDRSARGVAAALGLRLEELSDWNCCGATAYTSISKLPAMVLAARNLAIAEQAGTELVTACNGCFLALQKTNRAFRENPAAAAELKECLGAGGMTYDGGVRVRHFLELLVDEVGEDEIRARTKQPLNGLKVACYYGCQFSRPYGEVDDAEDPQMMDRLVTWLGGEPVPFPLKTRCCGGLLMTTREKLGRRLTGKILRQARRSRADCVSTACPLCMLNLEGYQDQAGAAVKADCRIPVVYFTQLVGAAFGLPSAEVAIEDSLTGAGELLAGKGVAS